MPIAIKMQAGGDSPCVVDAVPLTLFACRECGQVFVIFLDSDSSSLKARMWLEARLNDEHDAGRDQHDDVYSLPECREQSIDTPGGTRSVSSRGNHCGSL